MIRLFLLGQLFFFSFCRNEDIKKSIEINKTKYMMKDSICFKDSMLEQCFFSLSKNETDSIDFLFNKNYDTLNNNYLNVSHENQKLMYSTDEKLNTYLFSILFHSTSGSIQKVILAKIEKQIAIFKIKLIENDKNKEDMSIHLIKIKFTPKTKIKHIIFSD